MNSYDTPVLTKERLRIIIANKGECFDSAYNCNFILGCNECPLVREYSHITQKTPRRLHKYNKAISLWIEYYSLEELFDLLL